MLFRSHEPIIHTVRLVSDALGNWDYKSGIDMTQTYSGVWIVHASLPPGAMYGFSVGGEGVLPPGFRYDVGLITGHRKGLKGNVSPLADAPTGPAQACIEQQYENFNRKYVGVDSTYVWGTCAETCAAVTSEITVPSSRKPRARCHCSTATLRWLPPPSR